MWWNDYVGIPFLAKGRDKDGIDCWGLVRLVYKEQFNIELPSFSEEYEADDTARMKELVAQYLEGWEETKEPKPGTGVLFRILGFESHMGIYLGDNKFLHCRENQSAVIESLDKIEWRNRLVGFFNYTEKSFAALTVVPHPLKTERWNVPVPPGTTIGEISAFVMEQFKIPTELDQHITIMLNGRVVPKEEYTTVVKDTDVIEYRSVPGKSVLRIALVIAVVIAASYAPWATAVGEAFGATTAAAAVGGAVIATVGNLLIGALMPIRPPNTSSSDAGTTQSQLLVSGGSNTLNKYGSIPVVLGFVRMTPPLGAQNYVQSNTDTSYLNMMVVWGFGPLKVSDLYIGSTSIANYTDVNYTTLGDQVEGDSAADINFYNAYFSSDREQIYKGLTLKYNTGVTANFSDITTNRVEVTLHFPQGLRNLVVKGKNAGKTYDQSVTYNITYKLQGGSDQNHLTVPIPAKNVVLDGVFAGKYAYNWATEAAGNNTGTPYYRWYRIGIGDWGQYVVKSGVYTNTPITFNIPANLAGAYGANTGNSYGYNTTTDLTPFPSWGPTDIPLYDVLVYGSSIQKIDTSCRIPEFTYSGLGISSTSLVTTPTYDNTATVTGSTINTGDIKIVIASGSVTRTSTIAQTITRNSKDAFSQTIAMYVPTGQYSVTVTRTSDDNTEPNENDRPQFTMLFDSATSVSTNTSPIISPPNCTLTRSAIRIKATNQLNGNIEGINGYVQTFAQTYSASTGWGLGLTNNPASLFLYVLKHPANAYRITDQTTQINMSAIADWYTFCQDRGYTFNAVVSSTRSVLDVLRDICAAGKASPALVDGKWTVTIDRSQSTIVQHFTPNNSWGFEATKYLVKQPHGLRVIFNNEDKGFQEEETIVYNTGYNASTATILEQIQLPGITDASLVQQHARFHMAQAKLRPEIYTLNTDFEYLVCNRGDRVKVTHDIPMWGLASGRIKNRLPQLVSTFAKINITATSITTTATTIAAGVATINYSAQIVPPFEVGSVITISGSTVSHYNGTWIVASSTTTQTTFADGRWGTGNTPATANNAGIISSAIDDRVGVVPLTITTTATTIAPGTVTATFVTQIDYPFAVGSSVTITGAVPTHYNGTWTVVTCDNSTVTFTDPAWGSGNNPAAATTKGTITTLTPRLFELDEEVPLNEYTTYNFRVRAYNGASAVFTTTQVPDKGMYSIIGLTAGATAAQININDLFMFGTTTGESVDLLVMGVEPFGYQNAKLTLVAYDEKLYDYANYLAVNWSLPAWSSSITAAPKNLVQTITDVPTITSVLSDESVMDIISPGIFQVNIRVGFTNPATLPTLVTRVEAQMDRLGDDQTIWQYALSVPASMRAINFTNAEEGSYYKIRLRYVSSDGRVGPWISTLYSTVSAISTATEVLTVTTKENHSFSVGSKVQLYNSSVPLYNGFYTVRTAPVTAGATGTLTKNTFTTQPYALTTTSITSTSTASVAGIATATFAAEGYIPFVVGSQVTITGATPTNYNVTKTVTAATNSSVSWADTVWAATDATTQGSITQTAQTIALTSTATASVAGYTTATISPQSYISLNPGNSITISGATPTTYNGTKTIATVGTNFITWSDAPWAATAGTVQGTIKRNAVNPGIWLSSATTQYLKSYDGLNHLVVGKTTPPSAPTNFAAQAEYGTGRLVLTWNASPEIDVQYYEVRTDQNWGVTASGLVFFGDALYAISSPAAAGVGKNFYIKSIDYSKNYSTGTANLSYTLAGPPTVANTPAIATYLFNTSSLTDTNITFNWVMPIGVLSIARYELTLVKPGVGTLVQEITGLTWTTPANWMGTATLTIKTIDVLGNISASSASLSITKNYPASVLGGNNITKTPVGTGLLISWPVVAPVTNGMAVAGYEIRKEDVLANWGTSTGNLVYKGSVNNTTIDIKGITSTVATTVTPTYTATGTTTVTGTVTSTTGWSSGDVITITGASGTQQIKLNGTWPITVLTSTTFSFVVSTTVTAGSLTTGLGTAIKNTALTYYIKTYDADGRYSVDATSLYYIVAAPVDTAWSSNPAIFGDGSLTGSTITLTWNPATPVFGLYGYELSYTTTAGLLTTKILNTTSITLNSSAVWNSPGVGSVTFTIKVIDNLNITNKSAGVALPVVKLAPSPITNFSPKVVDNNVLLSWTAPVKTTLPIDHVSVLKGDTYANALNIGDKTGTFTIVFEQTGGTFTYWVVVYDTDGQPSTPVSAIVTVSQPPDYIFNAAYNSIFEGIKTEITNTQNGSTSITVKSTQGMYPGMLIILTGTTFGGLTAGYWYIASIVDSTTITISLYSILSPAFQGTSTTSGSMLLVDATGAEGVNTNSLYDTQGIIMPVDTTETFASHFSSRTWAGPAEQNTYFPLFIQPAKSSGYYEEVFNYTKTLASSQLTLNYSGTSYNNPLITTVLSTAGSVAGTTGAGGTGTAVTLTNTANSNAVTSSNSSPGLVVDGFITVPSATGQTVRITAVAGNNITVYPPIVAPNTNATFSYPAAWTNYSSTTALGTAFQYVKARITVDQVTKNAGPSPGTITAPGGTGPAITITSVTGAGTTTVTGTVASTTGWATGDKITITGATGTQQIKLNGTWTITVLTSTTFSFVVTTTVTAGSLTTGLGTATKSINITVTGTTGAAFTKTFKVGDVISIPNSAIGVDYTIASITSDTVLSATIPGGVTMPAYSTAISYGYKGTDLYKLTSLGVKLDAKQKSESGMVQDRGGTLSPNGEIVNFSTTFIDVASINLSSQGTTVPLTCIYNFIDTNVTGTYNVPGSTTCTVTTSVAHGFITGQLINVTFTSGTATSKAYLINTSGPTSNTFTIDLGGTGITASGTVSVYPNSMTVFAFTSAGGRTTTNPSISWTVRGF